MFNLKINGGNSSNLLFQFKLNACKMFKINEIELSTGIAQCYYNCLQQSTIGLVQSIIRTQMSNKNIILH